jgi:hypothetical protein
VNSARWDRAEAIARVRNEIWRYLTQAARTDDEIVLDASTLLQMRASEVRTLAQLHFILSPQVEALLSQMPLLLRRLTTTTTEEFETSAERVRGSIRWSETFAARAASGSSHTFVTAPARRAFNTPENELLAFALEAIRGFGRRTGWHRSTSAGAGSEVRRRVAEATRWLQARALAEIEIQPPTNRTTSRVRSGRARRSYKPVIDVVELYRRYLARLDRAAVREAIENHALVTSRDSVLLELLCTFRTISALRDLGWTAPKPGLVRPPHILSAVKGQQRLELYYQHAPPDLAQGSIYRAVQQAHRFAAVGGLIPDLAIRVSGPRDVRWIMLEVKGVQRAVEYSARAAAIDLLAYRRAFDTVLSRQEGPYGIGVAWGRSFAPSRDAEIVLCTPDTLAAALEAELAA